MRKAEKTLRELTKFLKKKRKDPQLHRGSVIIVREKASQIVYNNNRILYWRNAMSHVILRKLFTLTNLTFIIEEIVITGQ